MRRLLAGLLIVLAGGLAVALTALAQPKPEFELGFKALADQIPEVVGEPLEEERWGANGDSLQRTSKGLMVWRKTDNWTAFTDGSRTWINGPSGVQDRGNEERFDWEGAPPSPAPPAPAPTRPAQDAKIEGGGALPRPLAAWWLATWSEDGANLTVKYSAGTDRRSRTITESSSYSPYGGLLGGGRVTKLDGPDIYGRQQNMTIGEDSAFRGTVKPESVVAQGTLSYPAGTSPEQSLFAHRLTVSVRGEFDGAGRLKGATGSEEFSGHIPTSEGRVTYSGTATGTFAATYGRMAWVERTERTSYYRDGKPYAETVAVIVPQSQILGGALVRVRETVNTTTVLSDGSQRKSEVVIVWQRNQNGVATGMSAGGTVTGTAIVNGKPIPYTGSITLDYGLESRVGWHKVGYTEKRSAEVPLPKLLPFEVISISDFDLRPVF